MGTLVLESHLLFSSTILSQKSNLPNHHEHHEKRFLIHLLSISVNNGFYLPAIVARHLRRTLLLWKCVEVTGKLNSRLWTESFFPICKYHTIAFINRWLYLYTINIIGFWLIDPANIYLMCLKKKILDKEKYSEYDCKNAIGKSFMNLYCILNKFIPNLLAKFYFLVE